MLDPFLLEDGQCVGRGLGPGRLESLSYNLYDCRCIERDVAVGDCCIFEAVSSLVRLYVQG